MKWIGTQTIYDQVRFKKDITLYSAINDGNPTISLGSSATNRFEIISTYNSGAQTLDSVSLKTYTTSGTTDDGKIKFIVDEVQVGSFRDDGLFLNVSGSLTIGSGNAIISDSSGTTTLSNIDALDATTIATFETAMEANLDTFGSQMTSASALATVGTIGTGVWQGTRIASSYLDTDTAHLSGTQTFTGTKTFDNTISGAIDGQAATVATIAGLAPNTATTQAIQGNITSCENLATVGTIGTGVWQGTVIASAYLDADTMHYSAQKQITHHSFADDIDTTKHYIGFTGGDQEAELTTGTMVPLLAPVGGKLLKIFLRSNKNLQSLTFTWRLETQAGVNFGTGPSVVGTQSGVGCQNSTMTTYDFTTGLDSGDNLIDAGDMVYISIQSSGTTAATKFYITCLWEWDLS